jgi:hypothetical protein
LLDAFGILQLAQGFPRSPAERVGEDIVGEQAPRPDHRSWSGKGWCDRRGRLRRWKRWRWRHIRLRDAWLIEGGLCRLWLGLGRDLLRRDELDLDAILLGLRVQPLDARQQGQPAQQREMEAEGGDDAARWSPALLESEERHRLRRCGNQDRSHWRLPSRLPFAAQKSHQAGDFAAGAISG